MNNANNNSVKNHKKPKRKFNIVDFLILLLILTVIATAIFAIASWSSIEKLWTSNKVSLQYTVELRGVDAEFINNIKPGDAVSDSVTKTQLGTVNRVDSIEKYTVLSYEAKEVSKEECELGDIIQLGNESDGYYHTLIAVGFDNDDILIAAQTNDAFSRPLSSYSYDFARFIKILGVRIEVPSATDCFLSVYNGISLRPR